MNNKLTAQRAKTKRDLSTAVIYIMLYVVVMILLLKLITDLNMLGDKYYQTDTNTKYSLIDERKIIP